MPERIDVQDERFLKGLLQIDVIPFVEDDPRIVDLIFRTSSITLRLEKPIDGGDDLMRDGLGAGSALLLASARHHSLYNNSPMGSGECKVNRGGSFKDELLLFRALGETSVKSLKG
jgi:hypothetical protein